MKNASLRHIYHKMNKDEDDDRNPQAELIELLTKRQSVSSMNIYQKFANVEHNKIFEENLNISLDGTEVLFKAEKEIKGKRSVGIISIDLENQLLKIWDDSFEDQIWSDQNPYRVKSGVIPLVKNKSKKTEPTYESYRIDSNMEFNRPVKSNKKIILRIKQQIPNPNEFHKLQELLNLTFGSIFKVY